MTEELRLLAILAHPDDETLGLGGTLAKYAREGIKTYLVTATKGEKGRFGNKKESPGPEVVARTRKKELVNAAKILGIEEVVFLNYMDGELDQEDPGEIIPEIAGQIRRIKPQVVLTFDPAGAYGHPDHIAISQFATASIVRAADPNFTNKDNCPPHVVSKLYYMAWPEEKWRLYQSSFKELGSIVDGTRRIAQPWPEWEITSRINAKAYWKIVWEAVQCHQTQMAIYQKLADLTEKDHETLWGMLDFYRVFSTVNGGREIENDLFAGLR